MLERRVFFKPGLRWIFLDAICMIHLPSCWSNLHGVADRLLYSLWLKGGLGFGTVSPSSFALEPRETDLHPQKPTWIPKMTVWKRWLLLHMAILGIYLKFMVGREVTVASRSPSPHHSNFLWRGQRVSILVQHLDSVGHLESWGLFTHEYEYLQVCTFSNRHLNRP